MLLISYKWPLLGFRTLNVSISILFCWYICRSVSKGNVTSWNFFKWRPSERNKRETAKQRWRSLSANPCRFKMQCTCADAVCQVLGGWYASLLFSSFQKFDILWTLIWNIYTNMHSLKYFFKYYHSVFANNCFNMILSWLGYRSTYSSKVKNKSGYYDSIHFQYERLCYGWQLTLRIDFES